MNDDRPSVAEERARVQAERRAARAANRSHLESLADGRGGTLITVDIAVTAVTVALMMLGVIADRESTDGVVAAGSLVIAGAAVIGFLVALWSGAQRSRTHDLGIGGWFFLSGSAPRSVALRLNGCLAVQCVSVLVAASIRPYSAVVFGILIPMFGLAVNGVWGARYGWFPDRVDDRSEGSEASEGSEGSER